MNNVDIYKQKLEEFTQQKLELERQLILIDDQLKQQEEKLMNAFQTTDIEALSKIAEEYKKEIEQLEQQLNEGAVNGS